jgi:hypothetical protein
LKTEDSLEELYFAEKRSFFGLEITEASPKTKENKKRRKEWKGKRLI